MSAHRAHGERDDIFIVGELQLIKKKRKEKAKKIRAHTQQRSNKCRSPLFK